MAPFKTVAAGLVVMGALGSAAPAFAGSGCGYGHGKASITTTADAVDQTETQGQSKSPVLTKSTKTTEADG